MMVFFWEICHFISCLLRNELGCCSDFSDFSDLSEKYKFMENSYYYEDSNDPKEDY